VTDNGAEYLGSGAEPVVNAFVKVVDQADTTRFFSEYTDEQGQYSIQISSTNVKNQMSTSPDDFHLRQNYPNPFNSVTTIGYEIYRSSCVKIDVYNVLGQKVKTLLNGVQISSGQVVWNGTDEFDQSVPAGLYIYSMQVNDVRINRVERTSRPMNRILKLPMT
jgi:hypothetical protein